MANPSFPGAGNTLSPSTASTIASEQMLVDLFFEGKDKLLNPQKSGITMNDVLAHPDKFWDFSELSRNPNITMKDVLDHPELPWNYKNLSQNPSITADDISAHPELPWG